MYFYGYKQLYSCFVNKINFNYLKKHTKKQKTSTYTVNRRSDKIQPCLTPLEIVKYHHNVIWPHLKPLFAC